MEWNEKRDRLPMKNLIKALTGAARKVEIYEDADTGCWYVKSEIGGDGPNHGDWKCGSWDNARLQAKQTQAFIALQYYLHEASMDIHDYEEDHPITKVTRWEFWVCDYLIYANNEYSAAAAKFKENTP